jgi:hypothetical protein
MKFLFGSKSGREVPALAQSLAELQEALAGKQKEWAEQLANDPTSFAQLEQQIHLAFAQLADHCAASLLAHAAQQPACPEAAQKK